MVEEKIILDEQRRLNYASFDNRILFNLHLAFFRNRTSS